MIASLTERRPSDAENLRLYLPASEPPRLQLNAPDVVLNVAPTGSPVTPYVTTSPSPSVAETVNDKFTNAFAVLFPIDANTGAVFPRPDTFTVNAPFVASLLNVSIPLAPAPDEGT